MQLVAHSSAARDHKGNRIVLRAGLLEYEAHKQEQVCVVISMSELLSVAVVECSCIPRRDVLRRKMVQLLSYVG